MTGRIFARPDIRVKCNLKKIASTLSHVSGTLPEPLTTESSLQERLVRRLDEIPRGEFAAVAARAGMSERALLRIRSSSKAANVTLTTLARIAKGLQIPASAVIAVQGEDAYVRERTIEVPPPGYAEALSDVVRKLRDADQAVRAAQRATRKRRTR